MNALKQPNNRSVLSITAVITFFGFLDTHLLIPILALYTSELGASIGTVGLVIGLYSITNTPANILFGRLIDRIGYRWPLVGGLLGSALSMFLYTVSRFPIHLAMVRIIHGITGAPIGPATMSVFADYGSETRQGRAMGVYGMALASATLVGYGVSGVLASRLGYRAVFFLGSLILVLGALLSLLLPAGRRRSRLSGEKTALDGGFSRLKKLLGRRGLMVAYGAIFAQYFTFGGLVTLLPLHVKNLGMETFHVGMLLAAFAVMFIVFQFPAGAYSDRTGRLRPIVFSLGMAIISLLVLPSLSTFTWLALALAVYGAAYGILFPSISAMVVEHTTSQEHGMATGAFHALLTAGVAIGAPIMGWVGGLVGVQTGLMLTSVTMVLALLWTLGASKHI